MEIQAIVKMSPRGKIQPRSFINFYPNQISFSLLNFFNSFIGHPSIRSSKHIHSSNINRHHLPCLPSSNPPIIQSSTTMSAAGSADTVARHTRTKHAGPFYAMQDPPRRPRQQASPTVPEWFKVCKSG